MKASSAGSGFTSSIKNLKWLSVPSEETWTHRFCSNYRFNWTFHCRFSDWGHCMYIKCTTKQRQHSLFDSISSFKKSFFFFFLFKLPNSTVVVVVVVFNNDLKTKWPCGVLCLLCTPGANHGRTMSEWPLAPAHLIWSLTAFNKWLFKGRSPGQEFHFFFPRHFCFYKICFIDFWDLFLFFWTVFSDLCDYLLDKLYLSSWLGFSFVC